MGNPSAVIALMRGGGILWFADLWFTPEAAPCGEPPGSQRDMRGLALLPRRPGHSIGRIELGRAWQAIIGVVILGLLLGLVIALPS